MNRLTSPLLRLSALIGLFLAAGPTVFSQTPEHCVLIRFSGFQQSSAASLQASGGSVTAEVDFAQAPAAGTPVSIVGPSGTPYPLDLQTDGSFQVTLKYSSISARNSAFPEGNYTVTVGGTSGTSTPFNATFGSDVSGVPITNFDALQAVSSQVVYIDWAAIPGATQNDPMNVEIDDANGNTLVSAAQDPDPRSGQTFLGLYIAPASRKATGFIEYARATLSTAGSVGIATGSGFSVSFPIVFAAADPVFASVPIFTVQPQSAIPIAGSNVVFATNVQGAAAYQWTKDGIPIPNAIASSFVLPQATAADSGVYVLTASNLNGATQSAPATLTVPDALSVVTLAGQSTAGSADGAGAAAQFSGPSGVAVDVAGNVYVADTNNQTIRRITPQGVVTTLAGEPGVSGQADGQGSAARFNSPMGLAVDAAGNVYVADAFNNCVRRVTPSGLTTTLPGTFALPTGVAVDAGGDVYVTSYNDDTLKMIAPSGAISLVAGSQEYLPSSADGVGAAAQFYHPQGLSMDPAGNLYVIETDSSKMRHVTPAGVVTSVFAGYPPWHFTPVNGIAADSSGRLFVTCFNGTVVETSADGTSAVTLAGTAGVGGASRDGMGANATFDTAGPISFGPGGVLFICDTSGNSIRKATLIPGTPVTLPWNAQAQTVAAGGSAIFQAPPIQGTYEWLFNGAPINTGYSPQTYVLSNAQASNAGAYAVRITTSGVEAITAPVSLAVSSTQDVGRLVNISVRATGGAGPQALIAGFAVGGQGTTGTLDALVRASGPALAAFGVGGILPDPQLQLYSTSSGSSLVASNDGWAGVAAITTEAASVGAFPWTNTSSHDAAVAVSLAGGPYTANITGAGADSGVALAEVYDVRPAGTYAPSLPRLINISARTVAGTGSATLIGGFVIGGSTSRSVLIRASGPALTVFGLQGTLPDPYLQLYSGSGQLLETNYGWNGSSLIYNAANSVGAFSWSFGPSGDSALIATLPPGAYTAQVSSGSGATGIALIEVYELP